MFTLAKKFYAGWKESGKEVVQKKLIKEEKEMRDTLTEKQIDQRDRDSGPASDPASTY